MQTRACALDPRMKIHMDKLRNISNIRPKNAGQGTELIRAASQGDLSAFNTLVQAYQDSIFTLVYHLAPPGGDVVLIAQTVVQSIHRELPNYRGEAFRFWIYKQLVKVCWEAWRSKKASTSRRLLRRKNGTKSSYAKPAPAVELVGNEGPYHGSMQEVIIDCLHDLPFELRLALVLVDIEGLNYEMTAELLGKHKREIRGCLGMARGYLSQHLMDDPHSFETGIE